MMMRRTTKDDKYTILSEDAEDADGSLLTSPPLPPIHTLPSTLPQIALSPSLSEEDTPQLLQGPSTLKRSGNDIGIVVDPGEGAVKETIVTSTEASEPVQASGVRGNGGSPATPVLIVKSKAVEQVQDMLTKERKKNKKTWKENTKIFVVLIAAGVGLLMVICGIVLQLKFSDRILWNIPAYLWLYLIGVYIFSIIFTEPLAKFLVRVWNFSFFYENYIYYYTHGIVRGLHILLAVAFPWIYWTYFATQTIGSGTEFYNSTRWVPRMHLSFIVIGTCMIGEQLITKILAGKMQANNYREHIRSVIFLEKVFSHLSGKDQNQDLSITHNEMISSIKNVQKGAAALPVDPKESKKQRKPFRAFASFVSFSNVKAGTKGTHDKNRTKKLKSSEAIVSAADSLARKIFRKLDTKNVGYLTVENFKKAIHEADLAKSTFDIFDRNGDRYVSEQELASVIAEVYSHRKSLQHSLKTTKNLEQSLGEIVTAVVVVIAFLALLTVFGVNVQATMLTFSGFFLGFGFALGPFLQQLVFSIVMIFFVKPYDVGDRVSIGNEKEIYTVENIGIWVTDMLDGSGKRHYWHNGNLAKEHIVNHTRTTRVELSLELGLPLDTSNDTIQAIREALLDWVRSDTTLYSQSPSVTISNIIVQEKRLIVSVAIQLNCSWYDARRSKAKEEFLKYMHQLSNQLLLVPSSKDKAE